MSWDFHTLPPWEQGVLCVTMKEHIQNSNSLASCRSWVSVAIESQVKSRQERRPRKDLDHALGLINMAWQPIAIRRKIRTLFLFFFETLMKQQIGSRA